MSDIRNFEEYRRQVLDSLGEDYTVEDLRNFERWRLKVLHGLGGSGKIYSTLAVTDSASGSIASITDGADGLPIKSLNVNIAPKQSGSGDPSPSNVRPISGWDEVNVHRTGINITDEEWELGNINANGYPYDDSERMRTKNFNPCSPSTQYYVLFPTTGNDATLFFYDINKSFISTTGWIYKGVVTTPPNAYYIKMVLGRTYGTTYNHDISINYPSTDTEYHAHQGTSYPIPLPSTVYGGTLEVMSGKLTLTHAIVDLGTINWDTAGNRFISSNIRNLSVRKSNWSPSNPLPICSKYKYQAVLNGETTDLIFGIYDGYLYVRDLQYSTPSQFRDASAGVQICYELATPTEITLTPTQVETLLGNNNIYSSCGDVEVEYRADTKKYVDKKIAETQAMILENIGG